MTHVQSLAESIYERLKGGDLNVEERSLDIKKQWYHTQTSRLTSDMREEFCKDICALANSSFPSSGYLLFGLSTDAPFLFEASLPLDEASLQQQLGAGISPIPEVKFCELVIGGVRSSAAIVYPTVGNLPYVARYKNNLWIPWIRQGTSTRSASHLDLVSMFELRRGAEQRAIVRLAVAARLQWSGNWSTENGRWSPVNAAPPQGAAIPGLHTSIAIVNSGLLSTAIEALSAQLDWHDGTTAASGAACIVGSWPIAVSERSGSEVPITFHFPTTLANRLRDIRRLTITCTDIDQNTSSMVVESPTILAPP